MPGVASVCPVMAKNECSTPCTAWNFHSCNWPHCLIVYIYIYIYSSYNNPMSSCTPLLCAWIKDPNITSKISHDSPGRLDWRHRHWGRSNEGWAWRHSQQDPNRLPCVCSTSEMWRNVDEVETKGWTQLILWWLSCRCLAISEIMWTKRLWWQNKRNSP